MQTINKEQPKALAPFLQAIEVWLPTPEQEKLAWASGAYINNDDFGHKSREISFGPGEGVPGKAWESRLPIISKDLPEDDFLRGEAAAQIGIDCAVAIPVMQGKVCRGVVTMLCGGDSPQGAFEIWQRNDRDELGLSSSYYANLKRFGAISQFVRFPRRAGLPGETWSEREPKIVSRLGLSKSFMRAAGARAENLSTAITWPLMRSRRELDAVFMMLSAAKSPIASVVEIWKPNTETGKLQISEASYGPYVDLELPSRKMELSAGEGIAGSVLGEGAPLVIQDWGSEPARGEKLAEYGFTWGLGLPVYRGEELSAVVVMMH